LKTPYLRQSFQKNGKSVSSIISETLPNTVILAVSAIGIALVLGVLFGILTALYKDTFFDRFVAIVSTIGMSVPSFLSAIVFAWLFGFVLTEYTNLNMSGSLYEVDNFGEGVGAQGGNLQDVCQFGLNKDIGLLINSSRGIIYAGADKNFAAIAKQKAYELQQEMEVILNKY
jgi:peptide/nickel transport system permease protein